MLKRQLWVEISVLTIGREEGIELYFARGKGKLWRRVAHMIAFNMTIVLAITTAFRLSLPFSIRASSLIPAVMPPKRAASSSKRKASNSDSEEEFEKTTKKPKVAVTGTGTESDRASNGQPTNKVLPTAISFPSRTEKSVRIASWNVCGLAASQKKVRRRFRDCSGAIIDIVQGFRYYVEAEDPDILILTETKVI